MFNIDKSLNNIMGKKRSSNNVINNGFNNMFKNSNNIVNNMMIKNHLKGASIQMQIQWKGFTPQVKNILRRKYKDSDGDRIPDRWDCAPNNIFRQDTKLNKLMRQRVNKLPVYAVNTINEKGQFEASKVFNDKNHNKRAKQYISGLIKMHPGLITEIEQHPDTQIFIDSSGKMQNFRKQQVEQGNLPESEFDMSAVAEPSFNKKQPSAIYLGLSAFQKPQGSEIILDPTTIFHEYKHIDQSKTMTGKEWNKRYENELNIEHMERPSEIEAEQYEIKKTGERYHPELMEALYKNATEKEMNKIRKRARKERDENIAQGLQNLEQPFGEWNNMSKEQQITEQITQPDRDGDGVPDRDDCCPDDSTKQDSKPNKMIQQRISNLRNLNIGAGIIVEKGNARPQYYPYSVVTDSRSLQPVNKLLKRHPDIIREIEQHPEMRFYLSPYHKYGSSKSKGFYMKHIPENYEYQQMPKGDIVMSIEPKGIKTKQIFYHELKHGEQYNDLTPEEYAKDNEIYQKQRKENDILMEEFKKNPKKFRAVHYDIPVEQEADEFAINKIVQSAKPGGEDTIKYWLRTQKVPYKGVQDDIEFGILAKNAKERIKELKEQNIQKGFEQLEGASLEKQQEWQNMPEREQAVMQEMLPDSDNDNVPDQYDCDQLNPDKQDSKPNRLMAQRMRQATNKFAYDKEINKHQYNVMRGTLKRNPELITHMEENPDTQFAILSKPTYDRIDVIKSGEKSLGFFVPKEGLEYKEEPVKRRNLIAMPTNEFSKAPPNTRASRLFHEIGHLKDYKEKGYNAYHLSGTENNKLPWAEQPLEQTAINYNKQQMFTTPEGKKFIKFADTIDSNEDIPEEYKDRIINTIEDDLMKEQKIRAWQEHQKIFNEQQANETQTPEEEYLESHDEDNLHEWK